ncbi:hypothetical protein RHGRI_032181 [Rhododendron griersonianum]|uniref:ATP-dependent RNA helicase DHX29-like UBA domain-containing protein n=1 Tax=Rhododendron griersonianum TaxID=479676 RepID=A0AAV6IAX2_9ERIC|nr:hypothetical protein RHGRI_032181 [Rhododendron griersonianum]
MLCDLVENVNKRRHNLENVEISFLGQTAKLILVDKDGASLEAALDWLCLNLPGNELPLKFSTGTSLYTNEGGAVGIISTSRKDWGPSVDSSAKIEEETPELNDGASLEAALDWLCLNLPGNELPLKFSTGTSLYTNEAVNVIDAKTMSADPVAVVELPNRVPYGFHALFVTECVVGFFLLKEDISGPRGSDVVILLRKCRRIPAAAAVCAIQVL